MQQPTIGDTKIHNGAIAKPGALNPEVLERASGRRQFSAKCKTKILAEYDGLPRSERGELRRASLRSSLAELRRGVGNAMKERKRLPEK